MKSIHSRTLLLIAAALLFFPAAALRATYQIPLVAGWNLVSLPEQQTNTDVAFVTESIKGKFTAIWGFEEGRWSGYFPGKRASTLTRMDAGRAYWIHMVGDGVLVGAGMRPASALPLAQGWNFIGCNFATSLQPLEVFGADANAIQSVLTYENGAWKSFVPGGSGNTLAQLSPGQGYWVKAVAPSFANFGLTLNARVKVLSAAALASVTQVSSTGLTLASSQATGLSVGDILAGGVTTTTPNGIFCKVLGISSDGAVTTFTTEPAALTDAVTEGVVGCSIGLADQSTINALAAGLGPTESVRLDTMAAAVSGGGTYALPVIRLTLDRFVAVQGVPVRVSGDIVFEPSLLMNFTIESAQIRSFRVAAHGNESFTLSFAASQSINGSVTRTIFEKNLPPISFLVGALPVVIVPKLSIPVTLSGSFGETASAQLRQNGLITVGVKYEQGYGFTSIRELQNTFALSNADTVSLSASLTAGVQVDLDAYGISGPYVGLNAGLSMEAQTEANSATGGIYGIVGGEAGFTIFNADLGFWKLDASLGYSLPFEFYRKRLYPLGRGNVSGLVVSSGGPLAGVSVSAARGGLPVGGQGLTTADGAYTLDLPADSDYVLTFSKVGYASRMVSAIDVDDGETTSVSQVYLDPSTAPGTVRGTISNALSAQPVADALLTLRPGLQSAGAAEVGIVATASTDSSGRFEIDNLPPGYYTAVISHVGFIDGTMIILARGGVIAEGQNGTISPIIDGRNWRIVLTWGATPSDLDSHLTGPLAGSASRFHVFYSAKGSSAAAPYAQLDVDDVTSYGPETVTITQVLNGTYRYSVHDYSDRNLSTSTALAQSGAEVRVYRENSLVKTYAVPAQGGTLWTVFEIRDSVLTDINTMTYTSSPSSVAASPINADGTVSPSPQADPPTFWSKLPAKDSSDNGGK